MVQNQQDFCCFDLAGSVAAGRGGAVDEGGTAFNESEVCAP